MITDGGTPHTSQITVLDTPTLLVPSRTSQARGYRSALIIQQADAVDVTIGGSDVVAGEGFILKALPDSVSQPPAFGNAATNQEIYGIVASGTGKVNVYEEY